MAYGTLQTDVINSSTGLFSTNNAYNGIAKAWVNYNGSTNTVNNSFNVTSVTRTATGKYYITFTTAMANANYSVCGATGSSTGSGSPAGLIQLNMSAAEASIPPTTSALRFRTVTASYSATSNPTYVNIAVFGA